MKTQKSETRSETTSLEKAFEIYYPQLFRFFRYRGADVDTANDLASHVFERALRNLHNYDPNKGQLKTWLFSIAHNLQINHWKSHANYFNISLESENINIPSGLLPEDILVLDENKEEILSALQSLKRQAREIIAYKFGEGLTNRHISKLMGLSESNVGVILYRSLLELRRLLSITVEETRE
ncbi:MAG: RNA polymerase sigma factor [Anaerolineae bacterium]|nr:RNA polymerase sigma factor [Anaerolineae bacterium]